MKDLYSALGVGKKASADEIKKAHRKLVRQYHPDRNPGDAKAEERFKEVQHAYDVLGDPEKRKQYDRGQMNPFGSGAPGACGGGPCFHPGAGGGSAGCVASCKSSSADWRSRSSDAIGASDRSSRVVRRIASTTSAVLCSRSAKARVSFGLDMVGLLCWTVPCSNHRHDQPVGKWGSGMNW